MDKELEWIGDVHDYFGFDNLVFNPHPVVDGGVQATGNLPNGKWYSVVGGGYGLYGDGIDTWEVWGDGMGEPEGYLNRDEVEELLIKLQKD